MKRLVEFYKKILSTFNMRNYYDLADSTPKSAFKYYVSLVFNAFIIFLILMIPVFYQLPNTIENQFANIENFTFEINFATNAPITFPEKNPILLINYNNVTPTQSANIILNNDILHYGFLFGQRVKDISDFKDVTQKSSEFSNIIGLLLLLMIPAFVLIGYFYLLIKYLLIILVVSIIAKLITLLTHEIKFKQIFKMGIYAITMSIFLDLIFFVLGFDFLNIEYLPFIIYFIAGIIKVGERRKKKRGYVDL